MKTTIAFQPSIHRMLETAEVNVGQLLNACQSAANDVPAEFAGSKRSAFVPKAKGTEVHWNETDKQEFKGKSNSPLAFVSWHDATAKLHKAHGAPSGEMTPDSVPSGLRIWLETKFLTEAGKAKRDEAARLASEAARNAAPGQTPDRGVTPTPDATKPEGKPGRNGKRNGKPEETPAPEGAVK